MRPRNEGHEVGSASARVAMLCVLSVMAPQVRAADETITVETLLRKITDTRRLAVPPAAGERTVQFSSYDRASRLENGKIVHPFANGDRGHYLRVEGEGDHREWVLAEAQGPGYVSRIWSANPDGELRIYIDGAAVPALAAPFAAITNGEIAPFGAPFGHDASRGRNLYFPFPFAKSIKITTTRVGQVRTLNLESRTCRAGRFIPSLRSNGNQAPSRRKTSRSKPGPLATCPTRTCFPSAMPGLEDVNSGGSCTDPARNWTLSYP